MLACAYALVSLAGAAALGMALPAAAAGNHVVLPAGDLEWGPGPASLPEGAQAAVLYGDPGAKEVFALRLRLPDGYAIAPHTHPRPELVTVISGTLHLGTGPDVDGETERLDAGGFFGMEPGMIHFIHAEGETVVQLNSMGPWVIDYVNDEDDPRR